MDTQSLAASLPNIARFVSTEVVATGSTSTRAETGGEDVEVQNKSEATVEQAQKAVESINLVVQVFNKNVEFSVDKDTGIDVVKVVEKGSNEVIRQLPLDAVISFAKTLETLQGMLVKQKI